MSQHFTLRSTDLVHETLDGETVIIDLQTGAYYSAAGLASALFLRAVAGTSRSDLVEWVQNSFPNEPDQAEETGKFLDALIASNICIAAPADTTFPEVADLPAAADVYLPPVLEGYEDMADLLLLDPIHEVDPDAGWPNVKPDES